MKYEQPSGYYLSSIILRLKHLGKINERVLPISRLHVARFNVSTLTEIGHANISKTQPQCQCHLIMLHVAYNQFLIRYTQRASGPDNRKDDLPGVRLQCCTVGVGCSTLLVAEEVADAGLP